MRTAIWFLALFTLCIPIAYAADLPPEQFVDQIMATIKALGGLPWMGKVASILLLVIASLKVTFLRQLIWDRLGAAQVFVAPSLALAVGLLSLPKDQLSLAGLGAWALAGAGSILIHELLDGAKGIPGLGPVYVKIIDVLMTIFRAEKPGAKLLQVK